MLFEINQKMRLILFIILVGFIISLISTPILKDHFAINLDPPKFKEYRSDEMSFLKVFYLMEEGKGYYSSFKLSRENFIGGNILQKDVFTWREPTIFYIWSTLFYNGYQIFNFFIFLSLLFLASIYFLVKKITNKSLLSLISVLLLLPYLYDLLVLKVAFLFTEVWGLYFLVIGLSFLVYKKNLLAILLFTLAVMTRELFIIPVSLISLYVLVIQRKYIFLLPILVGAGFYIIHSFNVCSLVGATEGKFWERFHMFDLMLLQRMLSFAMRKYIFFGLKTHFLIEILGLVGIIGLFIKTRKTELLYLILTIIPFLVILPIIGVYENDYWGLFLVPMMIFSLVFMVELVYEYINFKQVSK